MDRRSFLTKAILAFAIATSLLASVPQANAQPKAITIGFIPGEDPQELKDNTEALGKLLQSKIGAPVNIYIGKDYYDLIDAMKNKKVDFAFFSAMTFVFAEKTAGAKVLMKKIWNGPYYYSTILANKATKLEQLKGKKFAFVDEKSTSGYLYPEVFFKKQNIDPKTFFASTAFTGNHADSVKKLASGELDAIAVYSNDAKDKDTAWDRFVPKDPKHKQKRPNKIWVSEPIPNDPFCVRQDFYDANPRLSTDLMFALRDLDDSSTESANFKKLLNINGLVLATSQQYDPVREMVKALDLKLDGK